VEKTLVSKAILRRIYWRAQKIVFRFNLSLLSLSPITFKGLRLSTLTPVHELIDLLSKLRPVENGFELIRIGKDSDGGYLIPNDLEGIKTCFSAGCNKDWGFEKDLEERFEIFSHIIDSEDKKPHDFRSGHTYTPMWLGPAKTKKAITFAQWVELCEPKEEKDFVLQMDIEGYEWLTLLRVEKELLQRFRILVIEFHGTESLTNKVQFNNVFKPTIEGLLQHFDPVHIHANNCCGTVEFGELQFPIVFEVTFHRKDRGLSYGGYRDLPHALDRTNVSANPEIAIKWSSNS
jgi:hypothetical protein